MELIRGIHNLNPGHKGCVAAIGGFDGVHLGHQAILQRLLQNSQTFGLPSTVITFEPLPREYFGRDSVPPRLMSFGNKLERFAQLGIDRCLCIPFNHHTAEQQADDFLQNVLLNGLNIRYLIIGDDFHFGKNRQGNYDYLIAASLQHKFKLESLPALTVDSNRISSTAIRTFLSQGALANATKMLGNPYFLSGRVLQGDQRGRKLGFPTANIFLKKMHSPISGVFVVTAHMANEKKAIQGIANIGIRPTFNGQKTQLEVHLFDFNAELYGQRMQVDFLHKIRDEKKFASANALKNQIAHDCQEARNYFHADA